MISLVSLLVLLQGPAPSGGDAGGACTADSCPRPPRGATGAPPQARVVVVEAPRDAPVATGDLALMRIERDCADAGVRIERRAASPWADAGSGPLLRGATLPAYVFLDGRGRERARVRGPQQEGELRRAIARYTGITCGTALPPWDRQG